MSRARSITRRTIAPRTTGARATSPRLGLALVVIAVAQLMVVLDATIVNVARPGQHGDQGKASQGGGDRRLAVGLLAAAATLRVACYLHLDGQMFFHTDTIPLSDLEHPGRELMPRCTSCNPPGTSDDASGPGRRPVLQVRSI